MISLQEAISTDISIEELDQLSTEELEKFALAAIQTRDALRQEKQILFYQPVSKEARRFHLSKAPQRVILGGNGSSKSESNLVDMVIGMTGLIPFSLGEDYPKEKLRPPIAARLIVQSLTNTWEQTIKPKLIWNHWTGLPDGIRGHWGWIPREFLIKGKWDESWSEKYRTLTLTNGSTLQVMSHDQDIEDFASASVHDIRIDEGPKHALWRENTMRLREGGYISLAMTPPDDESASWDAAWVYDELYEKGLPGPNKDPDTDSFTLFTEQNPYIAEDFIEKRGKGLTAAQKEVRFHGRFMHLGGRIYAIFSDRTQWWCFTCNKITFTSQNGKTICGICSGSDVTDFCHIVDPFNQAYTWPVAYLLDPHPRKPNMMAWVAVDPCDDWWQIHEMLVDGEPEDVQKKVFEFEGDMNLLIAKREIDPKMGESPAHSAGKRDVTVRDEYDAVGLRCALANCNFTTGRNRVTQMLKPDSRTRTPRCHIFKHCVTSTSQFLKFSWDEWTRYSSDDRDLKAKPKEKHDDFPKLFGYLGNSNPTYAGLTYGTSPMLGTRRPRRAAYG